MTVSQSLVLYSAPSSTTTSVGPSATSLIPSRFFTQQNGTAIVTELLYRILFDIIQRFLTSFQRLASKGMDRCSSWLERKLQEREERLANAKDGLQIVEEVSKLASQRGFITCPITGADTNGGGPQPPRWVRGVLEGIEEGIMEEKDFWIHTHTG
ncbi:uncharacterized protein EKO05_0004020 [Ascochyta rabiei]|uniref:Uncharacterized protein n=1 Tax=Didymella rabiei TaxID=5454 RepID=A0A162XZU6_DIDRA|nr:uncharacterized protein EKO05_0004020 [Ascochyta rabiei]KZM19756.1 hypothetical protein ST47_g9291 [Ascochyta rabiei]UPX13514.1 hypothetical protein EKO05_0004020 [Ascochyta rabiei]